MAKFKKGDVIRHPTTMTGKEYTVVSEEPDVFGQIVAKDNRGVYCTFPEHVFVLKPVPSKRYIVESRRLHLGDRYIHANRTEEATRADEALGIQRYVIVGEA